MGGRVLLLTAAGIPLGDRAAGEGADGAADDRADRAVAAAGDFMAGKAARDRADNGAAGALVALAIVAAITAVIVAVRTIIAAVVAAIIAAVITAVVAAIAGIIARITVAIARQRGVEGKRVAVRVDLGGARN